MGPSQVWVGHFHELGLSFFPPLVENYTRLKFRINKLFLLVLRLAQSWCANVEVANLVCIGLIPDESSLNVGHIEFVYQLNEVKKC